MIQVFITIVRWYSGKYFVSWFWWVWVIIKWLYCFGPLMRQHIVVGVHGKAKSLYIMSPRTKAARKKNTPGYNSSLWGTAPQKPMNPNAPPPKDLSPLNYTLGTHESLGDIPCLSYNIKEVETERLLYKQVS
jgi:hypothetical protein